MKPIFLQLLANAGLQHSPADSGGGRRRRTKDSLRPKGYREKQISFKKLDDEEKADDLTWFIASTATEDRDGDIILPDGIRTEQFAGNPLFLYMHNNRHLPAGTIEKWEVKDGKFLIGVQFIDPADFSDNPSEDVKRAIDMAVMYRRGVMKAVSIGFVPVDGMVERRDNGGFVFREIFLLEVSGVTIPSNPDVTQIARAFGVDPDDLNPETLAKAIADKVREELEDQKEGRVLSRANVDRCKSITEASLGLLKSNGHDPVQVVRDILGLDEDELEGDEEDEEDEDTNEEGDTSDEDEEEDEKGAGQVPVSKDITPEDVDTVVRRLTNMSEALNSLSGFIRAVAEAASDEVLSDEERSTLQQAADWASSTEEGAKDWSRQVASLQKEEEDEEEENEDDEESSDETSDDGDKKEIFELAY